MSLIENSRSECKKDSNQSSVTVNTFSDTVLKSLILTNLMSIARLSYSLQTTTAQAHYFLKVNDRCYSFLSRNSFTVEMIRSPFPKTRKETKKKVEGQFASEHRNQRDFPL